eukprot:2521341-Rhodomonas_salina.2
MGEHTATVQCQGTGGCTAMGEQAAPDATPNVIMAKEYLLWTAGLQILLNAEIAMLRDKQLGKALAHHRFVVKQPDTWYWDEQTKQYSKIAAIIEQAKSGNFTLTYPKRARTRVDCVGQEEERFYVQCLLDQTHNDPKTLEDLGINQTAIELANQTLLNLWSGAPLSARPTLVTEPTTTSTESPLPLTTAHSSSQSSMKHGECWLCRCRKDTTHWQTLTSLNQTRRTDWQL